MGGTAKVAEPFAQVFGQEVKTIDLTDYTTDYYYISLEEDDICKVAK